MAALLLAAAVCLGLGACGMGEDGIVIGGGDNPSQPSTVSVKVGTIATDSWGYTGSSPIQLTAPLKTEVLIQGHTLLQDPFKVGVSGLNFTKVSYSADKTSLFAAAQASVPTGFVSYVDIWLGFATSALPALSVTVDVGAVAPGETVTVYNYDAGTGKWISPQTAVVDGSGKITFPVSRLSLWGVFR